VKSFAREESNISKHHKLLKLGAMLGISLYSYPYLKLSNMLCLAYIFSSTKLEKREEQVLPGSKRGWGKKKGMRDRRERWPKQYMHI
jgi:hypothetical protein